MIEKTFYHNVPGEGEVKFSIFSKIINGKTYYYATLVKTEFEKDLSPLQRSTNYGVTMNQGTGKIIYKSNLQVLEDSIKEMYGTENLIESEI